MMSSIYLFSLQYTLFMFAAYNACIYGGKGMWLWFLFMLSWSVFGAIQTMFGLFFTGTLVAVCFSEPLSAIKSGVVRSYYNFKEDTSELDRYGRTVVLVGDKVVDLNTKYIEVKNKVTDTSIYAKLCVVGDKVTEVLIKLNFVIGNFVESTVSPPTFNTSNQRSSNTTPNTVPNMPPFPMPPFMEANMKIDPEKMKEMQDVQMKMQKDMLNMFNNLKVEADKALAKNGGKGKRKKKN